MVVIAQRRPLRHRDARPKGSRRARQVDRLAGRRFQQPLTGLPEVRQVDRVGVGTSQHLANQVGGQGRIPGFDKFQELPVLQAFALGLVAQGRLERFAGHVRVGDRRITARIAIGPQVQGPVQVPVQVLLGDIPGQELRRD